MPVVTTVFEFFLLLQSGINVVYRFRTVQSRCFAHSQKRVLAPLPQRFERLIRFLDRYAVPTGLHAGPRCCLGCCIVCYCVLCPMCVLLLCCAVLLCVCVYVLMRLCMCVFFAFLWLFWQSFWFERQKSQGLCGSFEVPFS